MEEGLVVDGAVEADDSSDLIREALAAYGPADGAEDALRVGFRKVRAEGAFKLIRLVGLLGKKPVVDLMVSPSRLLTRE